MGEIAVNYPLLECSECAIAIMQWLNSRGLSGTILLIRTRNWRRPFITSERYGFNESITINGKHYGVEVMGAVFDNLSREGLPRSAWISDFSCPTGQVIVEEISLSDLLSLED
ncbi:MAG: papain fold toxin domain-containing protein [Cyanobacteria bacterium J06621_3]